MNLLDGGYIPPAPGGDLLRDGTAVLPTGRNIHALDPYRMPAEGAWIRGMYNKPRNSILENNVLTHCLRSKVKTLLKRQLNSTWPIMMAHTRKLSPAPCGV